MKDRIQALIDIKANGRKAEFARQMGWSAQYLQKLLHGTIGLNPVQAICTRYPDVNARWLLLGEGDMLNVQASKLLQLLEMEKYICVMTEAEQMRFANGVIDLDNIPAWEEKLTAQHSEINKVFTEAYLHL